MNGERESSKGVFIQPFYRLPASCCVFPSSPNKRALRLTSNGGFSILLLPKSVNKVPHPLLDLPLPHLQPRRRIRIRIQILIGAQTPGPAAALRILEVVLQQQMRHDDFDLVAGEEAAGARILAVPEVQVVLVRHGGLVLLHLVRPGLAQPVVAERIECVGRRHERRVVHHRLGGYAEVCPRRKSRAV